MSAAQALAAGAAALKTLLAEMHSGHQGVASVLPEALQVRGR
jgi:hypothetical protein